MHNKYPFNQKGFTLIETAIATMIIIIGVVGVYAIIPRIIKMSIVSTDRFIAAQLAKEGVEVVRNFRDLALLSKDPNAWNNLVSYLAPCLGTVGIGNSPSSGGCEIDYNDTMSSPPASFSKYLGLNASNFYEYNNIVKNTKFKRRIIVEPAQPQGVDWPPANPAPVNDMLKVTVEVTWPEANRIKVFEELYNWR
ncbi:MAG: prepilin-type N-terminal cleavage/methylation domain-containing protein [Candidatus Pacebacteria bacterium]|nr:prepilin-type N-terminal cleavage/methylation domain-containing protein [Candidatus Paceibacterota bacterium]